MNVVVLFVLEVIVAGEKMYVVIFAEKHLLYLMMMNLNLVEILV